MALLPACGRNKAPNSLFEAAGYHVRGDKVYYLSALPGKAFEIAADAASFKAFDTTYAKDRSNAYFDGHPIPGADATSFDVLDRSGFAKDRNHVYQLDRPISDDPGHFELIDGGLSKDTAAVYWTDGSVLSDDPAHFAIDSPPTTTTCTRRTAAPSTSTGIPSPTPIRRHSTSCRAPMRKTLNTFSTSATRSRTPMPRRSVHSRVRMRATRGACTGWASRSTVPTPPRFAC